MSEEIIHLDLTNEEILILALEAHKQDMTLNDFIIKVVTEYIDRNSQE